MYLLSKDGIKKTAQDPVEITAYLEDLKAVLDQLASIDWTQLSGLDELLRGLASIDWISLSNKLDQLTTFLSTSTPTPPEQTTVELETGTMTFPQTPYT